MTAANPDIQAALERIDNRFGPARALLSPDAPGWSLAGAAAGATGRLAMGSGPNPEAARAACLGEIAETLAITNGDGPDAVEAFWLDGGKAFMAEAAPLRSTDPSDPDDPGSEGAAAGPDDAHAIRAAAFERCERAAVRDWWTGARPPTAISEHWAADAGVAALLIRARAGVASPRRVRLLVLAGPAPAWTIAAVSEAAEGDSEPVLGFAADNDPGRAARRAVSEALQMEFGLRLSKAAGARGRGEAHKSVFLRIAALETERRDLINPAKGELASPAPATESGPPPDLGPGAFAARLTMEEIGIPVWRVVAPSLPTLREMANAQIGPM